MQYCTDASKCHCLDPEERGTTPVVGCQNPEACNFDPNANTFHSLNALAMIEKAEGLPMKTAEDFGGQDQEASPEITPLRVLPEGMPQTPVEQLTVARGKQWDLTPVTK